MIHTSRRPRGARSLVVITSAALAGVVPLFGSAHEASADGPVRPRVRHHAVPTHRFARPRQFPRPGELGRPGRFGRPGGHAHRARNTQAQFAKVSIDTRAPAAPILPGKVYHWPFVVKNRGPVRADSVTFAAPLHGSLQFVSAQQNCSFKDSAAVCQLGSLNPGESKAGVVTALVGDKTPGGQPIDGNALVKWQNTAAKKEGRTTAAWPEVQVADTADVSVVKGGPAVVRPGQRVPYQITVANLGPTAAKNVRLTSTSVPVLAQASDDCAVPRGLQGPGQLGGPREQPDQGQGAGAPGLVCDIGTLKPGETRAIRINAQARQELEPGTVIQAPSHVTTSTIDNDLSNNHADARTKVASAPVRERVVPHSVPGAAPGSPGSGTPGSPGAGSGPGTTPGAGRGSELPDTGAPISQMLHLVVVLLGVGLILHRMGRSRRTQS
ncbi:hypothetical protein ACRYCC_24680 [Actinomadura scrupuli]|uniref:hypothetical protein n=1 Tax=Actinomadura scrupuli TaxID=559629 RepID=UPI003D951019